MRLAMYVDQVFWRDRAGYSTDESFILFPASFRAAADEITFIGRGAPEPGRAPYGLSDPSIKVATHAYYPRLRNFRDVLAVAPRIRREIRDIVREGASRWDVAIVDGPHPIAQLFARECLANGLTIVLMVRQNLIDQMRAASGIIGYAVVAAARLLEWDFRRLAKGRTVFTVGMEMADAYGQFTTRVHYHFPCLVDDAQFRRLSTLSVSQDPTRLICVSRLSPEKGHIFLFEAIALLRQRGTVCRLDVVGSGAIEAELKRRVAELALDDLVTFHGYVAFGPALMELYRSAGAFVLPSLPGEGVPQVINESLAIGLPTIATTVGGVRAFLTDNDTALLVPPNDVAALADAIERLVRSPELRQRIASNGRSLMSRNTLEVNRSRIIGVLRDEVLKCP
jgi:glycosyltransferase involved in cell wall biosynthesis